MNDRTLLELAAKAAGLKVRWHQESYYGPTMEIMEDESGGAPWNPLTDDGDALRLAVGLRFGIKDFAPHDNPELDDLPAFGMVEIWHEGDDDPIYVEWYKPGDDRCAATRRAIVRAAASLRWKWRTRLLYISLQTLHPANIR